MRRCPPSTKTIKPTTAIIKTIKKINASPATIQKVKDKLAQYSIRAVNYGVVGIPKDEAGARAATAARAATSRVRGEVIRRRAWIRS